MKDFDTNTHTPGLLHSEALGVCTPMLSLVSCDTSQMVCWHALSPWELGSCPSLLGFAVSATACDSWWINSLLQCEEIKSTGRSSGWHLGAAYN